MPVLHSLEHFLAVLLRDASDAVLNVGLMGCQTGLYLNAGIGDFDTMAALLEKALTAIGSSSAVPLANAIDCGWAENHSLDGAQSVAAWLRGGKQPPPPPP